MEAKCKYYGKCGGCTLQHIDYSIQLENKKNNLIKTINFENIEVYSGKDYNYRNRMDMLFTEKGIGFRKKGTWKEMLDVDECVISNNRLNELIKELREFFRENDAFNPVKHTGTFRYAVIRTPTEDSSISFVLNSDSMKLEQASEKIREFSEKTTAKNIVVTYVESNTDVSLSEEYYVVKGTEYLKEKYLGKEFTYPIQGFFQNNTEVAEKMQEYVNKILKTYNTKESHLLDLYGGVGTFGIINSELFKKVTIIESVKPSIDAAKINIETNNVKNAEAILLDAKHLQKIKTSGKTYVITDPPRSGMHPKTIQQLNVIKPEVIIYISCNIEQLGKDLEKFTGYKIKNAAMFDMFPQTNHIEAIVEMVKK